MSYLHSWFSTCTHFTAGGPCWNSLAEIKRWQDEVSRLTYIQVTRQLWGPLLPQKGLWSERWFKSAWDIWWCWYGNLACGCGWWCVCVSGCACTPVQECFPICFLCVFDRDERGLCSHVCWQEVRHSCTRPQLVSVRILCSFALTHFCSVFFSLFYFFCSFQSLGIGNVCFCFICLISSFTSSLFSCLCPASSLTGCMTEGKSCVQPPHCVPFDPAFLPILHQTPKGGRRALFAFDLATN